MEVLDKAETNRRTLASERALARWRSTESLAIYARLDPAGSAAWVSTALSQTTDSITTRRLPRLPLLDEFELMATFATADTILLPGVR